MQLLAVGSAMALLMEVLSHAGATVRIETVHVLRGETSATVSGRIGGYDSAQYIIGAGAGQAVAVRLSPQSEACALRVWTPGADDPEFIDARSGNDYVARDARPAIYTAQIHLTRGGARRGETCAYDLTFELIDGADVLAKAKERGRL
ncbi:MAG: hypothetical protein K2X60_02860 [Xanthobacteraceae bacterium]|nr:hypothetical protein [Xanthobacteraceae bacterium]